MATGPLAERRSFEYRSPTPRNESRPFPRDDIGEGSAFQQMPGFLVLGVAGIFAMRIEENVGLAVGAGDRKDIPSFGGDHVGGDEVDLIRGIGLAVGVEVTAVKSPSAFAGCI